MPHNYNFDFKLTSDGKIQPAITGGENSCFWLFPPWSLVSHALRPIFMLCLVKVWQVSSCGKFMQRLESCLLWQLKRKSFVSTCDLFNCLFLLHVQNEIQQLSGVFCYSWLVCFLSFWYYKSLVLLFKCIKGNGPDYISDLFEPRILRYNLRNNDHNLTQPSYNNRYYHNSFSYKASHLWNQLPSYLKRSTELSEYRKHLRSFNLTILRTSCL